MIVLIHRSIIFHNLILLVHLLIMICNLDHRHE